MKNTHFKKLSLACLLCSLIAAAGCCIQIGCGIGCGIALAKYERTVQLSSPLAPGSSFSAQTHNGSITIVGTETADCNLTATIVARAGSEEDAQKLAEQTQITLEPFGNKLTAKIKRPHLVLNHSIQVSLDAKLPNQTDLQLTTHNGAVKIDNITGQITATTHNGNVFASQISGNTKLKTHNGSVTGKQLSGDINFRTHNGKINAAYAKSAPPVCDVSLTTHNGGINFTAVPNYSAAIDATTHNGSINTKLPITVIGTVNKRKLTGTIGTGQGKLHLETHNGSISIK